MRNDKKAGGLTSGFRSETVNFAKRAPPLAAQKQAQP
jgi:hypothetical protein